MECPQCRHHNLPTARFCESCGCKLEQRCRHCAAPVRPNARFCHACGHSLSPAAGPQPSAVSIEGERRPATVMFCDLSGYTAMCERLDPEEVEELVGRIKASAVEIVERHGGTVSQFQGDGLLVLFGAPAAHDDDAVRAVRAARALHAMVRSISPEIEPRLQKPLRFHSGISSGLLVTSGRDARDGTIGVTGDTVNLGARLAALAGPDEILLSAQTQRQVADFFETTALQPAALKGKAEPVPAWRVERDTPTQTRFEAAERRGLTRFTGREEELTLLHAALARAITGQAQLVAVVGEPGIGKSRLAFEFRHSIDRGAVAVLEGRCQSHGTATPYLPFIDALRRGLQLRDDEPPEALHERAVASITGIDPELAQHLPQLLHLLSIPSLVYPPPAQLQGLELRASLERALIALIAASTVRRPMVLMFEDWHWADDASMAALPHLVERAMGCRLLVLLLHRLELKPEWTGVPRHTGLTLQALALSDTEAIIRSVLRTRRLPAGLGALVHERTAGNPFFTEELASAVVARGHLISTGDEVRVAEPLETLDLPETVQATIRARVDRLTQAARETLRVAAVLGREFARRVLEAVMRADAPLPLALEQLAAQDLIQPVRLLPEPEYMFKHVLIQAVMYETLLHQQRKVLHARAGAAIEALYADRLEEHYESLAHHYGHSADAAKAVHYLELAGDKAAKVFSLASARRHYQDAITLLDALEKAPEHLSRRVDITLKLARASHYAASKDTLATLEVARGYAQRLDDRHRMAQVASWMGGIYRMLGDHNQVFAVLGECAQLAEDLGDSEMLASAYHIMGRACYLTGAYRKGIDYMARGIDISERLGNLGEVSYSIGFSADCYAWLGEFDRALPLVERSMQLALDSGDVSRQGGANWYQAAVFCMQGEWDRGLQAATRCAELARRIGGAYLLGAGISAQGWAVFALGDRDRGIGLMQDGLSMMEGSGSRQGTGLYASWIADACATAGRCDEATAYAQKALAFLAEFGEGNGEAPSHRALALAAAAQSPPDWASVEQHIDESLRAAEAREERPQRAITLLRHGELLRRKAEERRAAQRLSEAREGFSELGMRWWVDETSRLLA